MRDRPLNSIPTTRLHARSLRPGVPARTSRCAQHPVVRRPTGSVSRSAMTARAPHKAAEQASAHTGPSSPNPARRPDPHGSAVPNPRWRKTAGPNRPGPQTDRSADPTSNPHHLRPRHPHHRTVRVAAGPPSTSTTPAHRGVPPTSRPRPRFRPTAVIAPPPNARGAADAPRYPPGTRSCSVRRRTNSRPRTGPEDPPWSVPSACSRWISFGLRSEQERKDHPRGDPGGEGHRFRQRRVLGRVTPSTGTNGHLKVGKPRTALEERLRPRPPDHGRTLHHGLVSLQRARTHTDSLTVVTVAQRPVTVHSQRHAQECQEPGRQGGPSPPQYGRHHGHHEERKHRAEQAAAQSRTLVATQLSPVAGQCPVHDLGNNRSRPGGQQHRPGGGITQTRDDGT